MLYINPRNMDKSQWLSEHALQVDEARVRAFDFESQATAEYLPCVYVDNGAFQAAGVAPDDPERDRWFRPDDVRPKVFFLVKKEVLFALHPEYREVLES